MPELVVVIMEHDGTTVAELERPANLTWTYQIGAVGPGKCQWRIADSDPLMEEDLIVPLDRDWKLLCDGFPLMAGPIKSINFPLGEDYVNVVGHDWLQWLDQPWRSYYPGVRDYTDDIDAIIAAADPTEFHAIFSDAAVQEWVEAILAPLSVDSDEQIILEPIFLGDTFAELLSGQIARSSSRTALSLLQELAAMGNPYGFDFWTNWNKELTMTGPRSTDPEAVLPIAGFFRESGYWFDEQFDVTPIVDGEWTNDGPLGTDILFTDGMGNTRRYFRKVDQDSVDRFRRWGYDYVIGSRDPVTLGTATQADFKAAAQSYRFMFPQKEIPLTVRADLFTYDKVLLEPVEVDFRKPLHRINANFWVTSQTYKESSDGSGDWLCDLTLDQIYIPIT